MKNGFIILTAVISSLLQFSCREDFSPKTEFKESYVLDCIITLDYQKYTSTYIVARITKVYNVDGTATPSQPMDSTVAGAEVYLQYRGSDIQLEQDTIRGKIYYTKFNLTIYPSMEVFLSAKMPDGKVLSSHTMLPPGIGFNYSYPFRNTFSPNINRFYFGESFSINWGHLGSDICFPQFLLKYSKYIPSSETDTAGVPLPSVFSYTKEIPSKYIETNGNYQAYYTTFTYSGGVTYDYAAVDSAAKDISAGDTAKSFYRLDGVDFLLYQFDDPLSKYYSSVHGSLDDYSIRVDQSVYTNISGGLGIFGCRTLTGNSWKMNAAYAHSFGYLGWQEILPGDTLGQGTNRNKMDNNFFEFLDKEK